MSTTPEQGAPRLPGRAPARAAAAAWAVTVLALGASAHAALAAPADDTVLVRLDPAAGAAARTEVGRALDATPAGPVVAGWRAYERDDPITVGRARALLADAPAADAVQLDQRLYPLDVPDDTYYGYQWALPRIGAPAAWDAATGGAPVTVAVIDTGVDISHPDLSGRLWTNSGEIPGNGLDDDADGLVDDVAGWNFADNNAQVYNASDGDSHGTHVAGTIAARRGNAAGVAGVADNARVMPLKFLKPGGGYTSDAMAAIDYAVRHGARVINASWGGSSYSQPLCDAIRLAGDAGVLFVAAAGNDAADNDSTPSWPANCPAPSLVSVAATTSADGLASFSNRGATQVDLGAPGDGILSTVPGGYGYKSGTSMATPHVTGAAAVLLGEDPSLQPWQVKAALMSGGDPVPALAGTTVSGRRLNLAGSLGVASDGVGADVTGPDPFAPLAPADGLATTQPQPTFRWAAASDAQSGVAGYRLLIDGATAATTATGVTSATPSAPLSEGSHTWTVVARDQIGNERSAVPRTLLVDRTPPAVPAPAAPADRAQVRGPSVTLSWSAAGDAVSGVASYRVTVDGVATATLPATARSTTVTLSHGAHTWQVQAVDGAGNASGSRTRALTVTGLAATPPARAIRLTAPRAAAGDRPVVLVRLARPATLVFSVRPAARPRALGTFRARLAAGQSAVRFPARLSRTLRGGKVYVVSARGAGTVDSVRFRVRPRAR